MNKWIRYLFEHDFFIIGALLFFGASIIYTLIKTLVQ